MDRRGAKMGCLGAATDLQWQKLEGGTRNRERRKRRQEEEEGMGCSHDCSKLETRVGEGKKKFQGRRVMFFPLRQKVTSSSSHGSRVATVPSQPMGFWWSVVDYPLQPHFSCRKNREEEGRKEGRGGRQLIINCLPVKQLTMVLKI